MAHSLVSDVRNALTPGGEASDKSTAAGLDPAQLQDAIDEADATINLYLSRYAIPTVGVPPTEEGGEPTLVAVQPVRFWSRNIAAWLATLTFKRNKDVAPDDPVRLRYNTTMAQLVAVRDGSLELPFPDAESGAGDATVYNQYEGRMFVPEDFGLTTANVRTPYHIWPGS